MTAPRDVVVIGPLNIDLIVVGDAPRDPAALVNWMALSDVTLNAAGSGGYPALVLQKLGLQVGMLSITAGDSLGEVIRYELSKAGIDLTRVRTAPNEPSSIAIYMLLFGSKKRPLTGRPVLHQPWPCPLDEADLNYIAGAQLVHVAGYLHYPQMWNDDIPAMFRAAKARGQKTSLDPQFPLYPIEGHWLPGVESLLPYTDVLLVDEDEAQGITGLSNVVEAGQMLKGYGVPIVAVKRGSAGALVFAGDDAPFEEPARQVAEADIADTIGAGDAFDAGFLAAWLAGRTTRESARIANYVASLSLRGHGAANTIPRKLIDLIPQALGT
ncbi:MAG: carbohydrate kinase family protein [Anaerolineae bacterium]|nr:carbohydrate kinase family protein [Anaerolineae bacterium]